MDVGSAIGRAVETTRRGLFRPLRLDAWLKLGVIFFFASFVDPTYGGYGRSLPRWRTTGPSGPGPAFEWPTWPHPVHVGWIVAAAGVALVGLSVVFVAFAWLGCRGSMMAYRAVRSDAGVALGAFRELATPANALFRSYAVVWAASAALGVPLAAHAAWLALAMHAAGASDQAIVRALLPHAVVASAVLASALVVVFFVRALVAPILFHLRCSAREAWRRTFDLARRNVGSIVVYACARVALGLVIGLAGTVVTFATCCVGGLPVIHQTLVAPLLYFERAFTLHVLASAGGAYADATVR